MNFSQEQAVVIVDVDGTLVPRGEQVPTAAAAAVASLSQHGVLLILATGRPFPAVQRLLDGLSLRADVAASNGNYVHAIDGWNQVVQPFTEAVVSAAVQVAGLNRAHAICFSTDGHYYATDSDASLEKVLRTYDEPDVVCVPAEALRRRAREYAHIHLIRAEGWQEAVTVSGATTATSEPPYITLTPSGVNKATGVQVLLKRRDCAPKALFVVGDGENDLPLFSLPNAVSVALASGHQRLRERAHIVAPGVSDGGFAWAVSEVILPTIAKESTRAG